MAVISLPAERQQRETRERVRMEIRALKGRDGTTQEQLAKVLGISQPQVGKRLRGEIPFQLDELDALADYYGIEVEDLIGGTRLGPRPGGPDGGQSVRHQGLEPRTRCYEALAA